MPPKQRSAGATLPTRVITHRAPRVQTSGVFKLPLELFFEIFSHFDDHRRYVRDTCIGWSGLSGVMSTQVVERSTVIRKLTMTCWALRNILLPVLWRNTEGCVVHLPSAGGTTGKTYGLYAQCAYLLSNPTIAAYVQILSVDLAFKDAPKDLMTKFVDTLVRLPNLRVLELLGVTHRSPVTRGLKRKCAKFPSIREMVVCLSYPDFIRCCPNLESLTFRHGFGRNSSNALSSYGAGLKRVRGVDTFLGSGTEPVVRACPKLQEISVHCDLRSGKDIVKHLQQAKYLSVVEINLVENGGPPGGDPDLLGKWKVMKEGLIDVLKNSSSKDRKLLRSNVTQTYQTAFDRRYVYFVVEDEELEVLPELSP